MSGRLNPFERFLNLFTQVRPGEGVAVATYFVFACLIIISYYIFKTLREPLLIASSTADAKAYATGLAALVLLIFMPIYSVLFRGCSRETLVAGLALAFSVMGAGFALLYSYGFEIGYFYYVWVSIYGVVMVAQFWVFTTGSFNIKSGKRLFPVIVVGASLGGLLGAKLSGYLINNTGLATGMYAASLVIGFTALLPYFARKQVPESSSCIDCHLHTKSSQVLGGVGVVYRSRLLMLIAAYALLLNIINSAGEYIFAESLINQVDQLGIVDIGEREKYIGMVYADFAFWVTAVALFLQIFVVSRVITHLGISIAVLVMPVALSVGYMLGGFFPVFTFIYVLKTLDNSLDYSITNTVRQILFLPVTHEEKFEGKTAIDTLFWRMGDLIQAGIVYAAINWFDWGIRELSMFCGALGIAWIYVGVKVVGEYNQRVREHGDEAPTLNQPIETITVIPGTVFEFQIPEETFATADPGDSLKLSAKLSNGDQLPSWLSFIPQKRTFTGLVPELNQTIGVRLTASDATGLSADNEFILQPAT
jgi:AAA family ATP:ADP antiporter